MGLLARKVLQFFGDQLSRLLPIALALSASLLSCALPVTPGCSPDDSLPGTESPLLSLVNISSAGTSGTYIDRTGRSRFNPDATVWMLSTASVCRTISTEDLQALDEAWMDVPLHSRDPSLNRNDWPLLAVSFFVGGKSRAEVLVKPGREDQFSALTYAVSLTLTVLERTYGDRFLEELRASGLEGLLREVPKTP